jgi:hypothetical protein
MKRREQKIFLNVLIAFMFMAFLTSTTAAATITVPDDGYTKIQDAINAATPDDTVYVKAGTYSPSTNGETFPLEMRNGVSLIGEGADVCILDAEQTSRVINCIGISDSSTTIDGFTITNGRVPGYERGGGIYCNLSSPTISNNIISGNISRMGGGISCSNSSFPTITHNTIIGNSAVQNNGYGGGISCYENSSPIITNNIITGNRSGYYGGGIDCMQSSPTITNNVITGNSTGYGGGISCMFGCSSAITNNTIKGNSAGGGGGFIVGYCSPTISNNIITGNSATYIGYGGGGIYRYGSGSPTITYDNVWSNSPDDYVGCSPGIGCISIDPLFVDPSVNDYHLQADSLCIDAGDNTALGLPAFDFDGNPRILDGDNDGNHVVDMGAFEYYGVIEVSIDIKPGSDPNSINLGSQGNVPVAILSTADFDATNIDPTTVTLAGASVKLKGKGTPMASFEDVNGDGLMDIVVHVDTTAFELSLGDTEALLEGETYDGVCIRGTDTVRIVND